MLHNVSHIKDYYRWRNNVLRPSTKTTWVAKTYPRYISKSAAATLVMLRKLRKYIPKHWGRCN